MNASSLFRPEIKKLKPYAPNPTLEQISMETKTPIGEIAKLDTGENPFLETLQKKSLQKINLFSYPDPLCTKLRTKLSTYTNFDSNWIMCGNGSDELIDLLIRLFVSPGEEIIVNPPTFPMYEVCGQLSGAKVLNILRKKDLTIDTEKIIRAASQKTKLIFIDSPGNPAGTVISKSEVEKLLKLNLIVVVDEAYFEYYKQTVLPLVKKYSNLIIIRTFSKWAGLAGLRLGYLITQPEIISALNLIKPPYNVNSIAQELGYNVLNNRTRFLSKLNEVIKLRNELIKNLSLIGLRVYPTESAYIVFQTKTSNLKLQEYLKNSGVLVKTINQPLMDNCIRVNVGRKKDMNKLITLLKKYYETK